jgi:hypothetical protein
MNSNSSEHRPWFLVALYAVAMAWVESAVVYYLRTHIDRIDPYQANPLPAGTGFEEAELIRELATMVMLLSVGWLAGKNGRSRIGYSLFAFGIWDIFYYVFLRVMTGWPKSLADWDVLFLIPLPWWGPVWAPASIAALMICWGTLVTQFERTAGRGGSNWKPLALGGLGALLAMFVFMADAIRTADQGVNALRSLLPVWFNWPLFSVALALMAAPVIQAAREALWPGRSLRAQPAAQ